MSFIVPEKIFDQHILALGKTRAGKSSAMRVLVEHLLDESKPVCIVDVKGDWWGLKSSANGKRAGYPLVIFGGEHADVPINAHSGATVAELAATGNRPCIIDLQGWMPGERSAFLIDFLSMFFRTSRGRRWLVIDEVHNVAPQGKVLDPQAGKLLHWSNRIASEGLGKGISLIAASQRPQKVHKDFVTSAETLIAMRVIHPLDRNAIKEWIDGCGDPAQGAEVLKTLASNQRGEGWVWSPEISFGPKRIQFPLFTTYDSFKAQDAQTPAKLRGWADVNLDAVKAKLESIVKEAEANDPAKLRARIRELEKQRPSAPTKQAAPAADPRSLREMERKMTAVQAEAKKLRVAGEMLVQKLGEVARTAASQFAVPLTASIMRKSVREIPVPKIQSRPVAPVAESNGNGDEKLRSGAERMLSALCQWAPAGMHEGQMRAMAGLKKSGTCSTYLSDLRRGGFLVERNGELYASEKGLAYCKTIPPAPSTTEEVVAIWSPKLRDGARRMMQVLIEENGNQISREELMERAGLAKSGTASTYLSDLRTARLAIVNRDGVAANPETLFLSSRAA